MSYKSKTYKKDFGNAREMSIRISKDELKPQHLGKKSVAVLQQELYALINTKSAFRDSNWKTKWIAVRDLSKEMKVWESLCIKYKLNSNEDFKKIL